MSVTLASQTLSDFCPISDLYDKIPALYAKISAIYSDICLFSLHCAGNVRGQVLVSRLRYIVNDGAHVLRGRGGDGRGTLVVMFLRECAHKIILTRYLL